MNAVRITVGTIESWRGSLRLKPGDLPFGMWQVFDKDAFDKCGTGLIVPIERIVSTKNHLLEPKFIAGAKADSRQRTFELMTAAARGELKTRHPVAVHVSSGGEFLVDDGNATVQVLMLTGWRQIPVCLSSLESISL